MLQLDRLLSLAYWVEAEPDPLQPAGRVICMLLVLALGAHLLWSLRTMRQRSPPAALRPLVPLACALSLAAASLRLAGIPGASARLWLVVTVALVLALDALDLFLLPEWPLLLKGWSAVWAFAPPPAGISAVAPALLGLHLSGLLATGQLMGWPVWVAPAILFLLSAPAILTGLWRWAHTNSSSAWEPPRLFGGQMPAALNALLPAYLLAGIEFARRVALHAGATVPVAPLPLLPVTTILLLYALAYQASHLWPGARRAGLWLPLTLLGAVLAWAAWSYLTLYARGVTGSDPFCYIRMAVDLMQQGTLLHQFPLAEVAQRLQIDPKPALHVGYRLPIYAQGWAATVWPPGHSALLGLIGRVAGARAIYLATPFAGLLSAAATAWLGAVLLDDLAPPWRWLAASLAGLLVATSYEQIRWLLVHMADISTQLFTTLTVALAWWGSRRRHFVGAGLALALAYHTRHTQLAMILPALAILALAGPARPRRERLLDALAFLSAALAAALPDLAYHQQLFGSPFRPESEELALYTLRAVPQTTLLLLRGCLAAQEFGWLLPFLALGVAALYRRNRTAWLALSLWPAALWVVQAPYASLRLRDLLPALPALALFAGYGAAWLLSRLAAHRPAGAVLASLTLAGLLWARTAPVAGLPASRGFDNFGFLWATQRNEFAALSRQTEPDAAIGSTLNTGPIELYGERLAFRPAAWPAADRRRFLHALLAEGRPVYLLDDGTAMGPVLAEARQWALLTPVHTLRRVPYFLPDAGSRIDDATLYRIEPQPLR